MTDNRKVYSEEEQFSPEFIEKYKDSHDFTKKMVPTLSPLAEKLISKVNGFKKPTVIVDWLAFSFPISGLRFCHSGGYSSGKINKLYAFPYPPKFDSLKANSLEAIEKNKVYIQSQLADFYIKTLEILMEHAFGLELSVSRGKGFNGYAESMHLRKNGVNVGFIALGGQRDTVYVNFTGTACKHIFEYTDHQRVHYWLNDVLGVSRLSRVDLAKDDYDGNFDCKYAEKAYLDGAFRTGKGGCMPIAIPSNKYGCDANGKMFFTQEMFKVGERTSPISWRNYDKKLEQKINDDRLSWYRSEVELKKWSVDCLLNVDAAFAGINAFAQSMMNCDGVMTKSLSKTKKACLELASRVSWYRSVAGRALADVLRICNGDMSTAIGLLLPDDLEGEFLGIPPTYKDLLNNVLEC